MEAAIRPGLGIVPVLVAVPVGVPLAVLGGGVRMPTVAVADAAPVEDVPLTRAGPQPGTNAFLPSETPAAPAAPAVPVYPRKQARH